MGGEDRRRDARFDKAVPVRLQFAGADDFLRAYTENISLGGVFVPTSVDVPLGTAVHLTVELQAGKGLQILAEVAWRRPATADAPTGVGLRFVEMKPEHRAWLEAAVRKYAAEHAAPVHLTPAPQLREPQATGLDAARLELKASPSIEADTVILGIDLGTSTTCACVIKDGRPALVPVGEGPDSEYTLPSVVSFDDQGREMVGRAALDGLATNARRTIYGAKRFIGRTYDHPEVQAMLSRYPYRVIPGPERRVAVEINNRAVSLQSVSAKILGTLRQKAEAWLHTPVHRAVITVPAFYNQNQRDAVVQAGRLAGLTVERILNEPTAAAIAYGLTGKEPRTILVYDLGGGTFDVSIMAVDGQTLTVLATAGDIYLGGEDFDALIASHVFDRHHHETGQHLSRNHASVARVKLAAELCKRRLSTHTETTVMVRDALLTDGTVCRVEMPVARRTIEALVEPLVTRSLHICDLALGEAKVHPSSLHEVLLVGGQTLMPYVKTRVAEHFGRPTQSRLRADEVVALGAGLFTQLLQQGATTLRDVLPMSIGIGLGGGRFHPLLRRNTPVPARVKHRIEVPRAQLKSYVLELYQGEAAEVERNEHLGSLRLAELSPGRQDPVPVEVELILSPDCLLKVKACQMESGQDIDILLDTKAP